MKWIYIFAGVLFYLKILFLPNFALDVSGLNIVGLVVEDSGVPNAVSGIIFRNRLYDTIFEVVVFSIATMGVKFLLADEQPSKTVYQFTDQPSIVLARLGATIAALISIELALRGHLSPGGGFAAGVAGGTAIGLIAITSDSTWMDEVYRRWRAALWEKASVLAFVAIAALSWVGLALPQGEMASLISGGWIPLLNIIVAIKVALGAWVTLLLFIRYRGLL